MCCPDQIEPAIPAPPEITNAPVAVDVAGVVCVMLTFAAAVSLVNVEEPDTDEPVAV